MRIAVHTRPTRGASHDRYLGNTSRALSDVGVTLLPFSRRERVPDADLLWDPGLETGPIPAVLRNTDLPVVATLHGVPTFSLPLRESGSTLRAMLGGGWDRVRLRWDWGWFKWKTSAIITPSEFGAQEARSAFDLAHAMVNPIHHGVDHDIYRPDGEARREPYFLMVVSNPGKTVRRKNVARVIQAWSQASDRADLVLLIPGYDGSLPSGVDTIREELREEDVADLYRGALALVFPSLYETFGMPIVEAMACGCPVITSESTACAEIAGDAALLVNPRSVDAIREAMEHVAGDGVRREELEANGIARAQEYTWEACAEEHLRVFTEVLEGEKWGRVDSASRAMLRISDLIDVLSLRIPEDSSFVTGAPNPVYRRAFLARLGREVYARALGGLGKLFSTRPTYITEREWDHLIILDACRHDAFCAVYGEEVPSITSPACYTHDWLRANFARNPDRSKLQDVWLVSANPIASAEYFNMHHWPFPMSGCINVWKEHWDQELLTVHPKNVTQEAVDVLDKYEPRRTIIHFLQPHAPYIGNIKYSTKDFVFFQPFDVTIDIGVWGLLAKGEATICRIKRAYESNLDLVMPYVNKLLDRLDGKVVVSADHGELFGEYGLHQHPVGAYVPELLTVPWLEVET